LRSLGRTEEAIRHLSEALRISKSAEDRVLEEIILREIGSTLCDQGDINNALTSFNSALELATRLGSLEGQASILSNIGSAFEAFGESNGALGSYLRSLNIFHKIGSLSNVASVEHTLGDFYAGHHRRFDMALDHFARALWLYEEIDDRHNMVDVLFKMGSAYQQPDHPSPERWRWEQAIWCFEAALIVAEDIQYDDMIELLKTRLPDEGTVQDACTSGGRPTDRG
jgi:tetratricopeptide (TPR) repeat protein